MNILSGLFNWLKNVFKDLLRLIKRAIPIVLLGIAIYLSLGFGFSIPALGIAIAPGAISALLVIGVSFLLAPGETVALVSNAAEAIGEAVAEVIETVVEVAASATESVLSASPLVWAGIALVAYFLIAGSDDDKRTPIELKVSS